MVTTTILHGITNNSVRVVCFRNLYRRVLLGGHTILYGIAHGSPRVDCFRNHYRRVGRVTHTILDGITNNSLRVDCIKNQYRRVYRVTARWAYRIPGTGPHTRYSSWQDCIMAGESRILYIVRI